MAPNRAPGTPSLSRMSQTDNFCHLDSPIADASIGSAVIGTENAYDEAGWRVRSTPPQSGPNVQRPGKGGRVVIGQLDGNPKASRDRGFVQTCRQARIRYRFIVRLLKRSRVLVRTTSGASVSAEIEAGMRAQATLNVHKPARLN